MAQHIHMIGIGGVGMSCIARVLLQMGHQVSGSDLKDSETLQQLQVAGATVYVGHDPSQVKDADTVVVSSAIPPDNPEVQEALARGIPVVHRSRMLAQLLNEREGIAVAGAHGKTTITGMIAHIFDRLGLDPTVLAGGNMQNGSVHARWGQGKYLVAEADESDRSFLRYHPHIAVITSLEADHLENYNGQAEALIAAYASFLSNVKAGGIAVVGQHAYTVLEDANVQGHFPPMIVYGIGSPSNRLSKDAWPHAALSTEAGYERNDKSVKGATGKEDYLARDIDLAGSHSSCKVFYRGELLGFMELSVPGVHNVENALAAVAVSRHVGLDFAAITRVLSEFRGAKRRFEWVGEVNDILVYDDYAHHPTEIQRTLQAARQGFKRRVVAVFQPHRYSRTRFLMEEFSHSFHDADMVIITDIYAPPPEKPLPGVSARKLAQLVAEHIGSEKVMYVPEMYKVIDYLLLRLVPGDLVLTMGAGDIWQVAHELVDRLKQKKAQPL